MAVSFNDLYNAKSATLSRGPMDATIAQQKREGAYTSALSDYASLMGGGGGTAAPATTRRTMSQPTMPTLPSMSESYGMSKGAVGGGKGGGGTNPLNPLGMPVYDTAKVEGMAQRFAAPGIRNLRRGLQDVTGGVYENPNVKRMTVRDALAGYGQGLENVMAGAMKEGANVYGQEYGANVQGALQSNQIASQQSMQSAQIASNEKISAQNASNELLNTKYKNEWAAYLTSLG